MEFHKFDQSVSPLILSKTMVVPTSINKHLTSTQRQILRFLFSHYIYKEGAILNSEKELFEILPLTIFMSLFVNNTPRSTLSKDLFLVLVLENQEERINKWRHFLTSLKIVSNSQSLGENTIPCNEASIFLIRFKHLDEHMNFLKSKSWTSIILDHFNGQTIKSELSRCKFFKSECRFYVSKKNIYSSKKYFWSMFDWIDKSSLLGSVEDFDKQNFQYYFNVHTRNSEKKSRRELIKILQALRNKRRYILKNMLHSLENKNELNFNVVHPWTEIITESGKINPSESTYSNNIGTVHIEKGEILVNTSANPSKNTHSDLLDIVNTIKEETQGNIIPEETSKLRNEQRSADSEEEFNYHKFFDSML